MYKLNGYAIDIRDKVHPAIDQSAEIDVKAVLKPKVIFCECKGKAPHNLVTAAEILEWYEGSFNRIYRWQKSNDHLPSQRRFEFYSSTDYAPDALPVIEKITASHVKTPVAFFNGRDILDRLKAHDQQSLVEIFANNLCNSDI